jgi:aryl-alcohol dehydrogenase-like predicted oxidoreductase
MEKRKLGNSSMEITRIGLGAWAIGGAWTYGWGPQDDAESIKTIHEALDRGVNWIDTAAAYGLGHSEEVVARAVGERREKPFVFTKCGIVWDENETISRTIQGDSIRREIESSLKRLDTDVIDLYQIHWPTPDEKVEEGWATLAKLRDEGKVRFIGVSNFSSEQLERAGRIAPVTSLQPPYSLVRREAEKELLPYCLKNGIGIIVYSPMASGLLTGKMTEQRVRNLHRTDWRRNNPEFQPPRLERNLRLAVLLGDIGRAHGRTAGETAIAWALKNPAVTGAIVGMRRPDQVEGVIHAADYEFSEEDVKRIEDFVNDNP